MVGPTIRQAHLTREAAASVYYQALDAWTSDPEDSRKAEKVIKARAAWSDAHNEFDRAQRRANWIRARRIITLAAAGRGQEWASKFRDSGFKVVR